MSELVMKPYLMFKGGAAAEALQFYQSVLGGELVITKFGEYPGAREDNKDLVMHGDLHSDRFGFFASDGMPDGDHVTGNNVQMCIGGDDREFITQAFEGLSEGGQVTQPLEQAPWGDSFGSLVDKYGINWMFNMAPAPSDDTDDSEVSNG